MLNKEKLISTTQFTAEGYAGGVGRTRFPTGGGFYWTDGGAGSPSITVGIAGDLFNASLGYSSSSSGGKYIKVPDTINYYRPYVKKHYTIKKYALYGRALGHGNTEYFIGYGYVNAMTGDEEYAVKA